METLSRFPCRFKRDGRLERGWNNTHEVEDADHYRKGERTITISSEPQSKY